MSQKKQKISHICFSKTCNKDNSSLALHEEAQALQCQSKHPTLVFSLNDVIEKIKSQEEQVYNLTQVQLQTFLNSNLQFQKIYKIFEEMFDINKVKDQPIDTLDGIIDRIISNITLIDKNKCKIQYNGYTIIERTLYQIDIFKQSLKKFEEQLKCINKDSFAQVQLKSLKINDIQSRPNQIANSCIQYPINDQTNCSQQSKQSKQYNTQILESQKNENIQLEQSGKQVQKSQARLHSQTQKLEYQEFQQEINKKQKKSTINEQRYLGDQLSYQFNQNQQVYANNWDNDNTFNSTAPTTPFLNNQDNLHDVKQQPVGHNSFKKALFPSKKSKKSMVNENISANKNANTSINQNASTSKRQSKKIQKYEEKGQQKIINFCKITKKEEPKQDDEEGEEDINNSNFQQNTVQPEMSIVLSTEKRIFICIDGDECEEEEQSYKLKEDLKNYLEQRKNKKCFQKLLGCANNILYAKKGRCILQSQINQQQQTSLEECIEQNCFCVIESKNQIVSISLTNGKLYLLQKINISQRKNAQIKIDQPNLIKNMSCCYNQAKDCLFLSILKESEVVCYEISMNKLEIISQIKHELSNNMFKSNQLNYQITCEVATDKQDKHQYIVIINDFEKLYTIKIENINSDSLVVSQNESLNVDEGISFVKCLKINNQLQVFLGTSKQTLMCLKIERNNLYQRINSLRHGISSDCFAINDNIVAVVVQTGIILYDLNKEPNQFKFSEIPTIFSAIMSNENIVVSFEKQEQSQNPFTLFNYKNGQLEQQQ
ncbi:hypothetical protein ABPG72_003616 [Tetrahymena utriculariae]